MIPDPEPLLRIGQEDDIPELAVHHRKMFEEIWKKGGIPVECSVMKQVEVNYAKKLHTEFPNGSCYAWVICKNKRIISSGAISTCSYVPVPHDPTPVIAFFHSVYTEPDERGHGYARLITQEAIEYCKTKGIVRLYLFASEDGRHIYHENGFIPVENMMMQLIHKID